MMIRKCLLFISLILSFCIAIPSWAADYYVASDGSGTTCSEGSPCALEYCCETKASSGDTVHLAAGTYEEDSTISVPVGVSLIGPVVDFSYPNWTTPPTAIIQAWSNANPVMEFSSASDNTNGNQSIQYVRFDGDSLTGDSAIKIKQRGNVTIQYVDIEDFEGKATGVGGIIIQGCSSAYTPPTTHATDIVIQDVRIVNCADIVEGNEYSGSLIIGGTNGAEICDCFIDNDTDNRDGYGIKYMCSDNDGVSNKQLKIHDNTIAVDVTGVYDFAIELWDTDDEIEIYNNTIRGAIDLATALHNNGDFGAKIYNNTIYRESLPGVHEKGIIFDKKANGIIIYGNYIYNMPCAFMASNQSADATDWQNIEIYQNVFYNIGRDGQGEKVIDFDAGVSSSVEIYNNVFDSANGYQAHAVKFGANASNVSIRNNVFRGATGSCIRVLGGVTITTMVHTHNYWYGMGGYLSNSGTITGETTNNITNADPDLTDAGDKPDPYYQPSSGSANVVDAGTDVGLDYSGSAPDIGRYEYDAGDVTPPTLSSATIASNGTTLTLVFDENVTEGEGYNDADWDMDISGGDQGVGITYSSGDGTDTHIYTVSQTIYSGETCDIDFNGDADSMEDDAGNDLAEITSDEVVNNSSQSQPAEVVFVIQGSSFMGAVR